MVNIAKAQAKAQLASILGMVQRLQHAQQCNGAVGQAREAIQEDALSVEVRSYWYTPGQDKGDGEYRICLCPDVPACQIVGELDERGQPKRAKLQYQDWFTPWEDYGELTDEEYDALLTYAQQFYFGR